MKRYYPAWAFTSLENPVWRIDEATSMIDAMLVALYGMSACVEKYGTGFTSEQLQEDMLKLDFDGISRRIRFDANGDVIAAATIN